MIDFNVMPYLKEIMPANVATKMSSYSYGSVPLATYGFIGVTVALLATAHFLDNDDDV